MLDKIRQFFIKNSRVLLTTTLVLAILLMGQVALRQFPQLSTLTTNIFNSFTPATNTLATPIQPNNFYHTERTVRTAILSQTQTDKLDQNRTNLHQGILSLFHNLQGDQQYDSIIVLLDPAYPTYESDPFADQAKFTFPSAKYQLINTANLGEEALLQQIKKYSGENPLIILHTYYSGNQTDVLLQESQQNHLKDVYDNPTKKSLLTLAYSNPEGLKAIYQYCKDHDSLKALPTLEDPDHHYQIKYFSPGNSFPTQNATLTFFGDIMLGRFVRSLMDSTSLEYPFQNMDSSYLRQNDLLIANLEGPIANQLITTTKSIAFRFLPDVAPLLQRHYFDLLSVANNHALDMGAQGLQDDQTILQQNEITPFGDPRGISEQSVTKQTINGISFAFLGMNNTDFKINQDDATKTIRTLTDQGFKVIPFIHWGVEYQHVPSKDQIQMAHAFVDAGAVAIIGMHPHVVESLEIYNQAPIFYSMGNAIFDQYFSPDVQEGLSATLHFTPTTIEIYLFPINIIKSQFSLMNDSQKTAFLQRFVGYWRYDQAIKEQIEKGKIVINIEK